MLTQSSCTDNRTTLILPRHSACLPLYQRHWSDFNLNSSTVLIRIRHALFYSSLLSIEAEKNGNKIKQALTLASMTALRPIFSKNTKIPENAFKGPRITLYKRQTKLNGSQLLIKSECCFILFPYPFCIHREVVNNSISANKDIIQSCF